MRLIPLTLTALVVILTGCTTLPSDGKVTITGADDAMETIVRVNTSTYNMVARDDHFFRAFINKESKAVTYQLYAVLTHSSWVFWDQAKALIGDDLLDFEAIEIGTDVNCGQYGCTHYEDVAVKVTRPLLDRMVNEGAKFRFNGKISGLNQDVDVDPEEVKAFLGEVDSVTK